MRRLRAVRLVGLIVLTILLSSSGAYWWSRWVRNREFEAFQIRVGRWGGGVSRSLNIQSPLMVFRGNGPSFIDPLLGTDGYHVWSRKPDLTGEQIRELLSLSSIRSLSIAPTPGFDDDCLIGLRDPAAILGLMLNDVNVTDRSLETIARMEGLSNLSLVGTSVSDGAVDRLLKLPKLNSFSVGGPNIRAIRLIDSGIFDESGRPAIHAGGPLRVRGRVAIQGRYGKPGNVRVFVRADGDQPPWLSHPYGWNANRGSVGMLVEESLGNWTFDVPVGGIPQGKSSVEVWVDKNPFVQPNFIRYRLEPFSIDLAPAVETREGVAEPERAR